MFAESEARQLDRAMRDEVQKTGKSPRDAFTDTMCQIPKKFKSSPLQQEVIMHMPSFAAVRHLGLLTTKTGQQP